MQHKGYLLIRSALELVHQILLQFVEVGEALQLIDIQIVLLLIEVKYLHSLARTLELETEKEREETPPAVLILWQLAQLLMQLDTYFDI